jgi:hypothetical protein
MRRIKVETEVECIGILGEEKLQAFKQLLEAILRADSSVRPYSC